MRPGKRYREFEEASHSEDSTSRGYGRAGSRIVKRARIITALLLLVSLVLVTPARHIGAQQATPTGEPPPPRGFDVTHIKLQDGYRIEVIAANLSVPTTAIFDGNDLLVAESGWANTALPRVLRIKPDWTVEVLASEGLSGPVTGLLVKDGQLYVSHAGKVSIVEAGGKLRDIVVGLPSNGDHQNNNIVLGPDGKIYMGQGTVTNSGVVDSGSRPWLRRVRIRPASSGRLVVTAPPSPVVITFRG